MAVRWAGDPPGLLYRIGRRPDPLAWPDWRYVGGERFDDPNGEFRVLYTAQQRIACFAETLAHFRPHLGLLATLGRVTSTDETVVLGEVPLEWCDNRLIGQLRLAPEQRWLDLRAPETIQALRHLLADELVRLGFDDFDFSDARGRHRGLTRRVARWAYARGFQGIVYRSRLGDEFDCWAIFEGAAFAPIGPPQPVSARNPDLRAAARLLGLTIAA